MSSTFVSGCAEVNFFPIEANGTWVAGTFVMIYYFCKLCVIFDIICSVYANLLFSQILVG